MGSNTRDGELRADLFRLLELYGYAFLPQLNANGSTLDVAKSIGRVVDLDSLLLGSGIPTVQRLRPQKQTKAPKRGYSGEFGLGGFPLHSDLAHWAVPPRYLMLRCIFGTSDVSTRLLPASAFEHAIGSETVRQALFRPRRSSRYGTMGLLPLVFLQGQHRGLRWDSLFLKPMNSAARDVAAFVSGTEEPWGEMEEVALASLGDTLLVDNWRMLHGRSAAAAQPNRTIERVYLSEMTV